MDDFFSKKYIELHGRSAFSFHRAASSPEQLVSQAATLELPGLALCERDGLYSAPRFHRAARKHGIRPFIGCELTLETNEVLPVLVASKTGYQNLCALLSRIKRRNPKNEGRATWTELAHFAEGLIALTGDEEGPLQRALRSNDPEEAKKALRRLRDTFGANQLYIELQRHYLRSEKKFIRDAAALAESFQLPLLATNGVLYATPQGRQVLDAFTCLRHHTHLDLAGTLLSVNAERHLKSPASMHSLFADFPEAVANTHRLAERLEFSLEELDYRFPDYPVGPGESMEARLRAETYRGARRRYRELTSEVTRQLEHELDLISRLGFAGYFLVVWDIVNFARENDILVQGRGSAANSAVCYSLGITAVDPISSQLLFERFLSEGRRSWPDIDLDFPSGEKRERVIQEVYRRYGPDGAAMTANVITYRGRSAMREMGKVLNLPNSFLDRFSNLFHSGDFPQTLDLIEQMHQAGIPKEHPRLPALISLYQQVYGLPRHLGQHTGGMVICQHGLSSVVPLENASMPGRVVLQWDKEDCEDLGIVKIDLLGLGMMAVIQDTLTLCRQRGLARQVELARIPKNDPATFELMQRADTVGVFQIESRAQMATLPRMKPKTFYDVAIEVAIIRPGPIAGNLTHPYLERRSGRKPIKYMHPSLKPVLERTLGIPLFQEQVLQMAMIMADFTGSEAEELRRALGFHKSPERMNQVLLKLQEALSQKGVDPSVQQEMIESIRSFALYGFPESHAISFALLAYASAWLKVHRTAEFFVELLNNQPMGFYSPDSLINDAKRHGVRVCPVNVVVSDWRCTVETNDTIRLGLNQVQGLGANTAQQLLEERSHTPWKSLHDFLARARLSKEQRRQLAEIGALNGLASHRRHAQWEAEHPPKTGDLFSWQETTESEGLLSPQTESIPQDDTEVLKPMSQIERLQADYRGLHLTVGPNPMALIRKQLKGVWRATELTSAHNGQAVRIAGLVICRQRPGTARGHLFISLEDETGIANAFVPNKTFERYRLVITEETFLLIEGLLQEEDGVTSVRARQIEPLSFCPFYQLQGPLSHDFR